MKGSRIKCDVPLAIAGVGKSEMKEASKRLAWGGIYDQKLEGINPGEAINHISSKKNDFALTMATDVALTNWIDPMVPVYTIKKSENDDSIIIGLEVVGNDNQPTISMPESVKQIIKTNFIEEEEKEVRQKLEGNNIKTDIGNAGIETFKIILK